MASTQREYFGVPKPAADSFQCPRQPSSTTMTDRTLVLFFYIYFKKSKKNGNEFLRYLQRNLRFVSLNFGFNN